MRTIQELNSKWYWRLIKVLYIGFLSIVFIASAVGLYYEFHTYDPSKINDTIKTIEKKRDKIDKLKNVFTEHNYTFSGVQDVISSNKGSDGLLNFGDKNILFLSMHLLIGLGKNIENIERCYYDNCGTNINTIYEVLYKKKDYKFDKIYINNQDVESLMKTVDSAQLEYNKIIGTLSDCLNHLENYCYLSDEYNFEKEHSIDIDIGYQSDYISLLGGIKLLLSIVGVILCIAIFTFLVRGITYYIILGKFNPEK